MEAGLRCRVINSNLTGLDMQTLIRESQEVMLGLTVAWFDAVLGVNS